MKNKSFLIGFFSGILIFIALNIYDFVPKTEVTCFDCYETFGLPFKFLGTGGFLTHTDILWFGLIADILFAVCFSFFVGLIFRFVWSKFTAQKLK